MAGDYSKFTFRPQRRYAAVQMQQGRVQLDSDWNEQAEILDRRLRLQAQDTYGSAWVPAATTSAAFVLTAQAGPPVDFGIGVGRMYVDGGMAEVLAGETWTYRHQPFLPDPPALPPSGTAVAYLEVWEREVTAIEDPSLLEIALGGPDTTTRRQVVWQVKIHALAGATCGVDLDALFPPSAGRLTTRAIAPPASDDACVLSPGGGYRGLENRLYRVEVHRAGGLGTATFKWSRDDASVVSRVTGLASSGTQTTVQVDRIGRDQVLRFKQDDWVEITDDHRELMGEPGEIARIAAPPDETALTITLDRVIPQGGSRAFGADTTAIKERHTRITRWDQGPSNTLDPVTRVSQVNGTTGVITIPSTELELEDGVRVTFALDGAGGEFKVGDFWVFHARTADGSVDALTVAPPRGIDRHRASLAVISDWSGATDPQDCRNLQPAAGAGCCTVNVAPGESIQTAIDSLPEAGGCVCLKTGEHAIQDTIRLHRSNVVLHGESPGTRVTARGLGALIEIGGTTATTVEDVVVEGIRFELEVAAQETFIAVLQDCARVRVRDCGLVYGASPPALVVGIGVFNARDVALASNRILRCAYGIFTGGLVQGLSVTRNRLSGLTYDTDVGTIPIAPWGVYVSPQTEAECRGNGIVDYLTGFHVADGATGTLIADNEIRRRALPGGVDTAPPPAGLVFAIEAAGDGARLEGNVVDLRAQVYGGIRVLGRDVRLAGNRIESDVEGPLVTGPVGVWIGSLAAGDSGRGDGAVVEDNALGGRQFGLVAHRARGVQATGNTIVQRERQGVGIWINEGVDAVVAGNRVVDSAVPLALTNGERSRATGNVITTAGVGIAIGGESALDVSGNLVEDAVGFGIGVFGLAGSHRFAHNRVAHCAYRAATLATGIGILQLEGPAVDVAIESCEVINTGVSPDRALATAGRAIGIAAGVLGGCQIAGNRVAYEGGNQLDASREHRALWLVGPLAYRVATGPGIVEIAQGGAVISGNVFQGPGRTHLVEVPQVPISDTFDLRFEKVTFSENRCDHTTTGGEAATTVRLFGSHLVVVGNHVKAATGVRAMTLGNRPRVALLANYTTGPIVDVSSTVPAPSTNFNVQI